MEIGLLQKLFWFILQPFYGEVTEWFKVHAWKACVRSKAVPGVRIPLSPPSIPLWREIMALSNVLRLIRNMIFSPQAEWHAIAADTSASPWTSLLAAMLFKMTIYHVMAKIGLPAAEPFAERRLAVIQNFAERLVPVYELGLLAPK